MRKQLHFLCLCFLILLPIIYACAQNGNYTIKHYNTENGLPQNSVRDVAIDKLGFVWIATENGLVRFDGNNFRVFKLDNTPALKHTDRIRYVLSDTNGHVFFNTSDMYLYEVNQTNIIKPVGHASNSEFIITQNKGLINLKQALTDFEYFNFPVARDGGIRNQLYKISNDEFYYFRDSLIYLKRNVVLKALCKVDDCVVVNDTAFNINPNGTITAWSKGEDLNNKFSFTGDIISDSLYKSHAAALEVIRAKDAFIIKLGNNYYKVDPNKNFLQTKILFKNVDLPKFENVVYDRLHDQYIICTISDGFYLIKNCFFTNVYQQIKPFDMFANAFSSQVLLPDDKIMVSKSVLFDKTGKEKNDVKFRGDVGISENDGSYWNSGYSHVLKISSNQKVLLDIPTTEEELVLFSKDTATGIVWCASPKTIFKINQTEKKLEPLRLPQFEDLRIWHISMENKNSMWIGTDRGLFLLNTVTLQLQKIKNSDGKIIRNVLTDITNHLAWVGTYGKGPCYVKDGELFQLPLDKNKNLLYAHYFVKDKKGFMWIPTNNGLYQAAITDLVDYTQHRTNVVYYQCYSNSDGFASNEFNGGYSGPWALRKDGVLSLCSMKGLVWFTPENVVPQQPDKPITIDKLTINGIDTNVVSNLQLPANYGQLSVGISIPYFGNKENLQIEYQVVGYSDQWIKVPSNNEITLVRYNHGKYQLNIRSMAGFGGKYVFASLPFKVLPAWYETIWFYLLVVILFILLALLFGRLRLNNLLKGKKLLEQEVLNRTSSLKETVENYKSINDQYEIVQQQLLDNDKAKEEMIGIILHDLWSPLNFIANVSGKMAKDRKKYSQEELFDFLETISGSTNEILHLTDELLKWLRNLAGGFKVDLREVNLAEVLKSIIKLYREIASQKGNQIILDCPANTMVVTDATLLTLIVRNIVDNANKNTKNGRIALVCKPAKNKTDYTITITDNGQGIESEKVKALMEMKGQDALGSGSLGLKFAFGFAKLIQATINIDSVVGKGTSVSITFPFANGQPLS